MTPCTCTVFARSGKLHRPDCPKRQAYEQREQPSAPAPSDRKTGKHGRIKEMMKQLRPDQEPVVDKQLSVLLGMQEDTK